MGFGESTGDIKRIILNDREDQLVMVCVGNFCDGM
jgi:hypothetical protein